MELITWHAFPCVLAHTRGSVFSGDRRYGARPSWRKRWVSNDDDDDGDEPWVQTRPEGPEGGFTLPTPACDVRARLGLLCFCGLVWALATTLHSLLSPPSCNHRTLQNEPCVLVPSRGNWSGMLVRTAAPVRPSPSTTRGSETSSLVTV